MAVVGIVAIIAAFVGAYYLSKKKKAIPGPPGVPILGNLPEFVANIDRLDDWLTELHEKHGETFVLSLLGKPDFVFTTNPENVEHILKTNFENYEKGPFFRDRFHDLLGNGIFNSDGEIWKPQRKISSNLFNVKNFKDGMVSTFVDHAKKVIQLIGKEESNCDISDLFYRYTLDSIGCIAFGHDIGSLHNPSISFAQAWDSTNYLVVERFWAFSLIFRKLFNSNEKKITESIQKMADFSAEILASRRKESPELREKRDDLLSLFMSRKDTDGEEFSDSYLRDMILNMILAGRDTTAQSLAWTCYLLAQHPEIRKKAMEEVDRVVGDADPDYDMLKELEYLHAIVTESLRLYPSVPRDPHTSGKDDVLPSGHRVKAGSIVFYVAYAMGRSKKIWGEDASEFKPERFYEDPKLATNTFKFTAFQGGPRTCLGQNMAYMEEKMMLAYIFKKYDFELVPNQNVSIQISLTLPMKQNLRLKFTPRMRR